MDDAVIVDKEEKAEYMPESEESDEDDYIEEVDINQERK